MRVLGIDPGYAIVGWGVVDYEVPKFTAVDYGAVTTPAGMEFGQRLKGVHGGVSKVIELYKPDAISLEQLAYGLPGTSPEFSLSWGMSCKQQDEFQNIAHFQFEMRSIANHTACAAASRSAFYRQNALVLNADARWRTAALRNVIDSYTVGTRRSKEGYLLIILER